MSGCVKALSLWGSSVVFHPLRRCYSHKVLNATYFGMAGQADAPVFLFQSVCVAYVYVCALYWFAYAIHIVVRRDLQNNCHNTVAVWRDSFSPTCPSVRILICVNGTDATYARLERFFVCFIFLVSMVSLRVVVSARPALEYMSRWIPCSPTNLLSESSVPDSYNNLPEIVKSQLNE